MRIKSIHINNYRAFHVRNDDEANLYKIDLLKGENLLLYGENGSGKSSLFRALKDFFSSATNLGHQFVENIFYIEKDNTEKPFISLTLDDNKGYIFSSDIARTDTNISPSIREANITKGFISYRDLLKLHFTGDNSDPDLFSFFLGKNGLLSDSLVVTPMYPENRLLVKDLWKKIQETNDLDAIKDFNLNVASQLVSLTSKANLLLAFFHRDVNLSIEYSDCKFENGRLIFPEIIFKSQLHGKDILKHHEFLNEARLTSLAISVYLSYILSLPVMQLQVLFLDDIFIGLDMSNRIPLLDILNSTDLGDGTSFEEFQIFVTTYDREWFEVAKEYLKGNWEKIEFYVDNNFNENIDRPFIRKSDSYLDKAKFHLLNFDYPACANYLRKEFESALRAILPENLLYPIYQGNEQINIESSFFLEKKRLSISESDEAWFFKSIDNSNTDSTKSSTFVSLQTLINKFKKLVDDLKIPFDQLKELLLIKNRILNPLSHDDLKSSVFKRELQMAFKILEELRQINSKILVKVEIKDPVYLFFDKIDANSGEEFIYKFQLLENLRYIEYLGFRKVLKSRCQPIDRLSKSENAKPEPNKDKIKNSLHDMCRGISILSLPKNNKGQELLIDDNFVLNSVYTIDNKFIKELI